MLKSDGDPLGQDFGIGIVIGDKEHERFEDIRLAPSVEVRVSRLFHPSASGNILTRNSRARR